jgi:hypothetical protein
MTIIACCLTPSDVILVADAVGVETLPVTRGLPAEEFTIARKIRYLPKAQKYLAIEGDRLLADAIDYLAWWERDAEFETDITTPIGLENLLQCHKHLRQALGNYWNKRGDRLDPPTPSTIVLASGKGLEVQRFELHDVENDSEGIVLSRRHELKEGMTTIFYGHSWNTLSIAPEDSATSLNDLVDHMVRFHATATARGEGLGYPDLGNRFSGIRISRGSGLFVERMNPYHSFLDLIYGHVGGAENWKILRQGCGWSPR